MKKGTKIMIISVIVLVVILMIIIGYSIKKNNIYNQKCGIESCYGLDIVCGPDVPEVCPAVYIIGDNCRKYALCKLVDGQCKLENSPKFDSCKACLEKCDIDYKNDTIKFFECESKCT